MRDPIAHHHKVRIGGFVKNGNAAGAAGARHDLEVHKLAEHIRRVTEAETSLTDAERAHLVLLLASAVAA